MGQIWRHFRSPTLSYISPPGIDVERRKVTERLERMERISACALQGILSNPRFYDYFIKEQRIPGTGGFPVLAATYATDYAVALINRQDKIREHAEASLQSSKLQ